jgi:hypothetical protein
VVIGTLWLSTTFMVGSYVQARRDRPQARIASEPAERRTRSDIVGLGVRIAPWAARVPVAVPASLRLGVQLGTAMVRWSDIRDAAPSIDDLG